MKVYAICNLDTPELCDRCMKPASTVIRRKFMLQWSLAELSQLLKAGLSTEPVPYTQQLCPQCDKIDPLVAKALANRTSPYPAG